MRILTQTLVGLALVAQVVPAFAQLEGTGNGAGAGAGAGGGMLLVLWC